MSKTPKFVTNSLKALFVPTSSVDRLTFTTYAGSDIAASSGSQDVRPKNKVVLQINPQELQYEKNKITQKIQTSTPGRFVVYDWGTDILMLSIRGSTGNLIPESVRRGETALNDFTDAMGKEIGGELGGALKKADNFVRDNIIGSTSYSDLIAMSPRFHAFMELHTLYENFDADQDILILELSDHAYRGFFQNFSFTHSAESPWNWKYEIVFASLYDFGNYKSRGDPQIPNKPNVDKTK